MDTIKVIPRSKENGNRNKLLEDSKIPCVIYGKGSKSESLSIELKTISTLVKTNTFYSKVLSIELNGKKEKVLPKEVQYHPVSSNIIHVDFMRVQDSTKVTVEVPVNFLNKEKCIGIKQGGVLNTVRRSVELICNAIQSIILLNRYSIYNIGTLEPVSRFEFAYKISEIFNLNSELIKSVETKFLNQKAKRPMNTFLKFDKSVEELGIEVFSSDYYLKRIMKKINE